MLIVSFVLRCPADCFLVWRRSIRALPNRVGGAVELLRGVRGVRSGQRKAGSGSA